MAARPPPMQCAPPSPKSAPARCPPERPLATRWRSLTRLPDHRCVRCSTPPVSCCTPISAGQFSPRRSPARCRARRARCRPRSPSTDRAPRGPGWSPCAVRARTSTRRARRRRHAHAAAARQRRRGSRERVRGLDRVGERVDVGSAGAPLDDAAEAETEREREVPRDVPGRIDRAREPEARQTAGGRRAGVLKRREHGPGGVEPQADAHRRAEQAAAGRALEADEAAVDHAQGQPETAAQPGVAIALGGQREARRTLVVLGGGAGGDVGGRGVGGIRAPSRAGSGRRLGRSGVADAGTARASASISTAAGVHRSRAGARGGSRPARPPGRRAGREVPLGDRRS